MRGQTVFFLVFLVAWLVPAHLALAGTGSLEIRAPARVSQGDPFLVRIDSAVGFNEVILTWSGRSIPLPLSFEDNHYSGKLLLGTDVKDQSLGTKILAVRAEKYGLAQSRRKEILVVKRQAPVQRLTLPQDMVSLSREALNRHRKEKREVAAVFSRLSGERLWSCPFQLPARGGISSAYGLKRILNGQPRSPHRGLDLRSGDRAPVSACNDGRIALIAEHYFAGRSIYIDHGLGVVSMYFHLSGVEVREGERVKKGQLIGRTGSSGRATGPHLHFGLSLQGALVDPVPLFDPACGSGF
ncbi:MAG: M23 family metallopeptidase [Desulfohalobiaceae bacterium]|nr:M23 family metallopeptidase [Desulfohalobiaceae bacterium]